MSLFKYQNWSSATPIIFKTKINCDLITLVFQRFMKFACFYFEFALYASPWYFSSFVSLAVEIALVLITQHSIKKCPNHTIRASFAHRTHLQRLILLEPRTYVTYDPNVSQCLLHRWFFFKAWRWPVIGRRWVPSFPTSIWHL